MIRCTECEHLMPWSDRVKMPWPKKHKRFFSCVLHRTDNGTCTMWSKLPKTPPRWCKKYLEVKE